MKGENKSEIKSESKLTATASAVRDFVRDKSIAGGTFALCVFSGSALAAGEPSYVPSFITSEALQPLATAIISVIGIVGGVVIGVLATAISAKVGIGLIKSFFSRAS